MENFISSANISSDFEFKYIPQQQFEKMVMRVRKDRERNFWGSFCSVTSGNDDNECDGDSVNKAGSAKGSKALSNDEIQSIVKSYDRGEIIRRIPPVKAPFFGPARKLDLTSFQKDAEKSKPSTASTETSDAGTFEIIEEVNVAAPEPLESGEVQVKTRNDCCDDGGNDCMSADEKESLQSDMLKLCNEIDNAIGGSMNSRDNSSLDLTYQEEKAFQSIIDKNEEKVFCETYSKFIDEKFDFLYDDCESSGMDGVEAQTLPVVELREKTKMSKKLPANNKNNVCNPKTENQIRKSERHQENEKSKGGEKEKKKGEVSGFPSDVITRKARQVGRMKHDGNENSRNHSAARRTQPSETKIVDVDEHIQSMAEIHAALGRNTQFQKKICQYLDYLREIVEDPPELEDMDELRKRQQRASEFANRFARNHLYQIGRTAEEIRLMPDNPEDVAAKTNLLFQAMVMAVQTYLKNVEMFIYNNYPDKLLVLIDFIINALKICFDRMALDKSDLVIQRMLHKCLDMKRFLEMNQMSLARFASIQQKRRKSLVSRSSFAFENGYGTSKLSMYEMPKMKKSASKQKVESFKSPYDSVKPRNLRSSASNVHSRQSSALIRTKTSKPPVSRANATQMLKASRSNVSTMMGQMASNPSDDSIAEFPRQSAEPVNNQESKELELMEMMKSIAKEKLQEMLGPLLKDFAANKSCNDLNGVIPKRVQATEVPARVEAIEIPKPTTSRVTSDRKPDCQQNQEKVSVAKNIQYLYVKSSDDKCKGDDGTPSKTQLLNRHQSCDDLSKAAKHRPTSKTKVNDSNATKVDPKLMKKLKEQACADRVAYVEQMMENPLYTNDAQSEPWKLFARISDEIVDDMLRSAVSELDFGEKSFVENFLCRELEIRN